MLFLWRTFFKYEGNIGYLKITIIIEKEKLFFFCFARRITLITVLKVAELIEGDYLDS